MFVVDDEQIERDGIMSFCDWQDLGISIIGEARNGKVALEALRGKRVDIIVSDVKMPIMDGLQFASEIKKIQPDVKIIFISGYDDFEAARNAITLNAFAYLLKPIKMTELLICVRKAAGLHRKEKERHQEEIMLKKQLDESMPLLRMKFLRDLYQTVEETGEEDILQRGTFLGLPIEAGKYCIVVAMIDSFRAFSMNRGVEEIQMELIKITNAIKESVRETSDYPIVATREGEFTLLFRFTSILNEDEIMQHVETIGREIRDAVNQCSQLSVTLGVSMISKDVTGFSRMYIQARRIVDQRFYLGTNRLLWYDEERFIDRRTISDVSRVQEQMEEAINSMDSQEVRKVINNYFSVLLSSNSENREYVQSICMELVSTAIRILHERNESLERILGPGVSPWIKLMEFDTNSTIIRTHDGGMAYHGCQHIYRYL